MTLAVIKRGKQTDSSNIYLVFDWENEVFWEFKNELNVSVNILRLIFSA